MGQAPPVLFCLLVILVDCGGASTHGPPSPFETTAPAVSVAPSAGRPPPPATSDGAPTGRQPPPGPTRQATGAVMVMQIGAPGALRAEAIAYFYDTRFLGRPDTRQEPAAAGCEVRVYEALPPGSHTTTRPSAGSIHVATPSSTVVLTTSGSEVYQGSPAVDPLVGGETVTFRASGNPAGVPAFEGSVDAPAFVSVTSPTLSRGSSPTVHQNRSQNLVVRWSPAASGLLVVELSSRAQGAKNVTLICSEDARRRTLTIPSEALAHLNAGAALLEVQQVSARHVRAGAFNVELSVRNHQGYAHFELH